MCILLLSARLFFSRFVCARVRERVRVRHFHPSRCLLFLRVSGQAVTHHAAVTAALGALGAGAIGLVAAEFRVSAVAGDVSTLPLSALLPWMRNVQYAHAEVCCH